MFTTTPIIKAQTVVTQKGVEDYSAKTSKNFNFSGTLYKNDTTYTYGVDLSGFQPVFDFSHYVTYSNDSVKVNYVLQGYYSYIAHWADLKALGVDSLKNTYCVYSDSIKYNPDSLRVMIYGDTAAIGSNIANGKATIYKGSLKLPKKY